MRCWKTRSHKVPSQSGVGDVEVGDIAKAELDGECGGAGPPSGFGEHRLAGLDAEDGTFRPDPPDEGTGDVAGAAAHVDETMTEAGAEQLTGGGAKPLDGRDRRLFVECGDQGRGLRFGVDGAEAPRAGLPATVLMPAWHGSSRPRNRRRHRRLTRGPP